MLPTYKFPAAAQSLSLGIETDAEKLFFRIIGSNDPQSSLLSGDFNGSTISNFAEILQGTDPFYWEDLLGNGLPDSWELFWFDVIGSVPPSGDFEADGLTELQEFAAGTNPTQADHPLVSLQISTPLKSDN